MTAAKIKILPCTRLGLIEMTRESKRESLLPCWARNARNATPSAGSFARIDVHTPQARDHSCSRTVTTAIRSKLALNPAVAEYFNERRQRLENMVKHKLVITSDPDNTVGGVQNPH